MFFFKLNLHELPDMALGTFVWDASATMIDVSLENAINMRSVWAAGFQFWGKQQHLHIDVLFFPQYCECASKKKGIKNATTPRHRILVSRLPDGHLKFECSILHSNMDFLF